MNTKLRFMLLQVRNADDPMREQEVRCFARALSCEIEQINAVDLINDHSGVLNLSRTKLDHVDAVLIGGSGDYSVAKGGPWLPAALEVMAELVAINKPTFASCWGFQAMAQALGGQVIHDPDNAELGTLPITLTPDGEADDLFGRLNPHDPVGAATTFLAVMGHEDRVAKLPANAVRLASTQRVANQAFRLRGQPIFATQFHPELDTAALVQRLQTYQRYVECFAGMPLVQFQRELRPTPAAARIIPFFVETVFN